MFSRSCFSLFSRFARKFSGASRYVGSEISHVEVLESRIAPASAAAAVLAGGSEDDRVTEAEALVGDETTVTLALDPTSVVEDGTVNLVYTFTRTGAIDQPLTVNFAVVGPAGFNSDYTQSGAATFTSSGGTVTFPAGSATASVILDPKDDLEIEPDETVSLTLQNGVSYVVGTAAPVTGVITNDEIQVLVSTTSSTVAEDGQAKLIYTFTRYGVLTDPLAVNFLVSGTASFATDYTQTGAGSFSSDAGSVVFPANSNTVSVTIDPAADSTVEPSETVVVTVVNGPGYTALGQPGVGTITNDDVEVSVTPATLSILEDSGSQFSVTFRRLGGSSNTTSFVNFEIGGTAIRSVDYNIVTNVTINGSTGTVPVGGNFEFATISFIALSDTLVEDDKTITITVKPGNGYVVGSSSSSVFTIKDDDTVVSLEGTVSTSSENSSTGLLYTVSRGAANPVKDVAVHFNISGAAGFLTDYRLTGAASFEGSSGTVIIPAGSSSATFSILPIDDTLVEGAEHLNVALGGGSGYVLGQLTQASGTLVDNDTATVEFLSATSTTKEGTLMSEVEVALIVTANGVKGVGSLTKEVSAIVGDLLTGTAGASDYAFIGPSIVTFPGGSGSSTQKVFVSTTDDAVEEDSETVLLGLGPVFEPTGQVALGSKNSHTLSIANQDFDLEISAESSLPNVIAGSGAGNLTHTITLTNHGAFAVKDLLLAENLTLISGATIESIVPSAGTYTSTVGLDGTWSIEQLDPGESVDLTVTFTVGASAAAGASILSRTTLTVAGVTQDVELLETPIQRVVDLQVTASAGDARGVPGQSLVYTVNVSNAGPSDASGMILTGMLPSGTSFNAAASSAGWVESAPGHFTLNLGALLGGGDRDPILFAATMNNALPAGSAAIDGSFSVADDGTAGADANPLDNAATVPTPLYRGIYAFSLGALLPQVKVYDVANGELVLDFMAYDSKVNSGIRVAVGDLNGDGVDDIVTSTLKGTGRIRVFDGIDGAPLAIGGQTEINPFSAKANGGANIAIGDVTGDGRNDIIVGAGAKGRLVKVYDGVTGEIAAQFKSFWGGAGGVRVATGDLNGDGVAEIIVGQVAGGSGVRVYTGGALSSDEVPELLLKTRLGGSDGVHLAAANVTGDSKLELLLGSGDHSPSKLVVYSPESRSVLYETNAFSSPGGRGLRVAGVDVDFDGVAEIIAVPGGKAAGQISFMAESNGTFMIDHLLRPFPSVSKSGIFAAGSKPVPVA